MAELPQLAARPIIRVAVDQIDTPADRLRSLKAGQAAAIGTAIAADRQYDPISIARLPGQSRYILVDGLHRLEGCRSAGLAEIDARLVDADRASRRRQEVLSAWARADHDAFDYAAQVSELAELHKAVAGDEDDCSIVLQGARWDEATATALKLHRTNVFRYLKLHRFYTAEQKKVLRDKGLANELMPLLRLADLMAERFAVAWHHIETAEEPTIAEALALAAPGTVNGWDKQKAKVLTQAKTWRPDQISELINELRELRRTITGEDAE